MKRSDVAIVIDSCTDVSPDDIERYGMYVVPLMVNYDNGSFLDKVNITPQEVYDRFDEEIPRTSTPTPAIVREVFDRVVADGYAQAVVVTISSGLSSTFDLLRSVSAGVAHLSVLMVDSLNIGLGAGLVVMAVARMVEQGASLADIERAVPGIVENTKVYFCVDTLDYLRRGGRIGKVTYAVGSLLDMRPIISCNEEGVYYTVAKAKGRKASLKRTMACAEKFAGRFSSCMMAVANGDAPSEAQWVREQLEGRISQAHAWYEGQVSPALVVHTGPGLVGVAVQGVAEE